MAGNTNKPTTAPASPATSEETKTGTIRTAGTPQSKTVKPSRRAGTRYSETGEKADKKERYSNA